MFDFMVPTPFAAARSSSTGRCAGDRSRRLGRRLALALRLAALSGGVAIVVPCSPGVAHAQAGKKPPAKDPKLAEAKKLFERATEAYGQGRYEDAIRDWEKSYELSGKALIFESIANAYERLGDKEKALSALKKWRAEAPTEEHEQLDSRILAMEQRIAAAAAADKARKDEEEKKKADSEGAARAEKEAREKARSTRLTLALVAGGAGVLAVGAGITLGVIGAGQRPSGDVCASAGDKTLCPTSARDAIETSSTLTLAGDISWIAGAVLVAGGAALFFTLPSADPPPAAKGEKEPSVAPAKEGRSRPPERWFSVAPLVGPTGAGVGVTGSF